MHRFQICCASIDAFNRAYVCSSTSGALEASFNQEVKVLRGYAYMRWQYASGQEGARCLLIEELRRYFVFASIGRQDYGRIAE